MTHKILLNKHTSECFEHNEEWQRIFLRTEETYFNDLLISRGYVYLNQIYEALGVKWDPNEGNPCRIRTLTDATGIKFKVRKIKNGFNLTVTW